MTDKMYVYYRPTHWRTRATAKPEVDAKEE